MERCEQIQTYVLRRRRWSASAMGRVWGEREGIKCGLSIWVSNANNLHSKRMEKKRMGFRGKPGFPANGKRGQSCKERSAG